MTREKKFQITASAQDRLMSAMQTAFDHFGATVVAEGPDDDQALELAELDKQFRRVEKLFGYVPGSYSRGS